MDIDQPAEKEAMQIEVIAAGGFLRIEVLAYMILGLLLALTTLLGLGSAGISLWIAAQQYGAADSIVATIDRLLFVLMLVEILHTVRVSFRSGELVGEPFLIVGLIASIRRVLVITLHSSQANQPGKLTPETQVLFNGNMLELGVLAGLILVMVLSIYMLRRSDRLTADGRKSLNRS